VRGGFAFLGSELIERYFLVRAVVRGQKVASLYVSHLNI
jgi:hypothetical protein